MPHFNAEAFENHLSTVPDDLLIEMAEDGIITQDEIHELLEVLDVDPELAAAIERHADVVGRTILDYVEQHIPGAMVEGHCHLTGHQAVEVMRHLLEKGLISKFYESGSESSMQEGLPQGKTIHDVGKSSAAPKGRR